MAMDTSTHKSRLTIAGTKTYGIWIQYSTNVTIGRWEKKERLL